MPEKFEVLNLDERAKRLLIDLGFRKYGGVMQQLVVKHLRELLESVGYEFDPVDYMDLDVTEAKPQ